MCNRRRALVRNLLARAQAAFLDLLLWIGSAPGACAELILRDAIFVLDM